MIRTVLCALTIIAIAAIVTIERNPILQNTLLWWMQAVLWSCGGMVALCVCGFGLWMAHRMQRRERTMIDGAWTMQRYRVRVWRSELPWPVALWEYIRGYHGELDRNRIVAAAWYVRSDGLVIEHTPASGWEVQHVYNLAVESTNYVRAAVPGDDVWNTPYGQHATPPRLLAPRQPRVTVPMLPAPDDDIVDGDYAPVAMSVQEALALATPQRWPLGYNQHGKMIYFEPVTQHNIGIVGAQGTGKTASTGFHLLLLALKFGWHTLILDPKGGVDLRPFAGHCEWRPTDADRFGEQIAAVRQEHERRHELLVASGAPNIDALTDERLPHILVFCEEYGAIWEEIETTKKRTEANAIDHDIDTMMRLSRMTGIHFCFVDQFPERWSKQVFMAVKFRIVYQVAPGQDSYLREYNAHDLPDRGVFQHRRQRWHAWHIAPELHTLLATLPASPHDELTCYQPTNTRSSPVTNAPFAGRSPGVRPEVAPPPPFPTNAAAKWRAWIEEYMASHPGLYEEPPVGVRDMARAMALLETGNANNFSRYLGIASDTAKTIRMERQNAPPVDDESLTPLEQPEDLTPLEQLKREFGGDLSNVRLANGERFGVDVTYMINGRH